MSDTLSIRVAGIEELRRALKDTPGALEQAMQPAGDEIGRTILGTEGLRRYPPTTSANQPPVPYYQRGQGTQYAGGNSGKSERYGTQFYVESKGYTTTIGNRASYAPYLADDELQARSMAAKGWRKLIDVARDKIDEIKRIYDAWVAYALKKAGL